MGERGFVALLQQPLSWSRLVGLPEPDELALGDKTPYVAVSERQRLPMHPEGIGHSQLTLPRKPGKRRISASMGGATQVVPPFHGQTTPQRGQSEWITKLLG